MKIELTDKQVYDVLENMSQNQLYTYLAVNQTKSFNMFISLLINKYNDERHINIIKNLLVKIPIQKELF